MLNTSLFHWNLPNPIIVASGPLGAHRNIIEKHFKFGAGAVVTKTITPMPDEKSGGVRTYKEMLFNRDGYSNRTLGEWELDLEQLREKRIIANLFAKSPSELADLAIWAVNLGVEIIELGLSCPTDDKDPICVNLPLLEKYCIEVRKSVDVPIIVKTILNTSIQANHQMVNILQKTGVDGVCIADTMPALILDKDGNLILGGPGGLSGSTLKPLVMKSIYDIRETNLRVIAIGGIETGQDIVDYIRLGASAVQVCSFLIKNKVSKMSNLVDDLEMAVAKTNNTLDGLRASVYE